jgi:hypothetical protein
MRAADVCDRDRADAELYPVLRIPLSTLCSPRRTGLTAKACSITATVSRETLDQRADMPRRVKRGRGDVHNALNGGTCREPR